MRPLKLLGTLLMFSAALGLWGTASSAQTTNPVIEMHNYAVTYFSGNKSSNPDETLRVVNTGDIGDVDLPSGDICVNVYVFDANQEMTECCSCPDSANGMLTFSVQKNLTANTLTSIPLPTGVIKVTASVPGSGGTCSPTTLANLPAEDVLAAWQSHLNPAPSGISVTEDELATVPLSLSEATDLTQDCTDAIELGSGHGVCTCPAIM